MRPALARIRVTAALSVAVLSLVGGGAVAAQQPSVGGLPDGGPAILHRSLATSPQLENTGIWHAEPILVSGASAYREGEFLYQDHLYDDRGDGSSPYPNEPAAYAGNAADFVELRLRPLGAATAVRITYNTFLRPDLVATTLAFGTSSPVRQWPHGARTASPAQVFVTVHGETAEVVDAATGTPVAGAAVPVTVDLARRQIEVRVPHSVFDPTGQTAVRVAAATGVWDVAAGQYRAPDTGAALYNVAFRYDETTHPRGIPVATWFRDTNQAAALTARDISRFSASIDFTKLAAGTDDDMANQLGGVPVTGSMTRIYVSHFADGQGRGTTTNRTTSCDPPACSMEFRGALQPYFIHVPATKPGAAGYGLTVYLHGCGNNHNEMFGSRYAQQMSERGGGTVVVAGGARGGCLWYQGAAGANVFEVWADAATRYPLNPDVTALTGYSMGGYGTFNTATLYPELWARGLGIHPCTAAGTHQVRTQIASLRHVPLALWYSANDPLCQITPLRQIRDDMDARGYGTNMFTLANDHFTDITNDVLTPAVDWIGGARVVSNPAHVTYVVNPAFQQPQYGLNPDHAYWVSGLTTRGAAIGTIDVVSHGLGAGDGGVLPLQAGAGVLTGGALVPALPYTFETRDPAPAPAAPVSDTIAVTATNIGALTIDPARAGVTCAAALVVQTDGPLTITLAGCPQGPQPFEG